MCDIQILRQELYANSPFDLASDNDNIYRDAVDAALASYRKFEREHT
jgi:hypothetical protein